MKSILTTTVSACALALSAGAWAQNPDAYTATPQTPQQARTIDPGSQAALNGGATIPARGLDMQSMSRMDRQTLMAMDLNGDGMVSKAEYMSFHDAAFDRLVSQAAQPR